MCQSQRLYQVKSYTNVKQSIRKNGSPNCNSNSICNNINCLLCIDACRISNHNIETVSNAVLRRLYGE